MRGCKEAAHLDVRVGTDRVRHGASVLRKLRGTKGADGFNAENGAAVHVGAELLVLGAKRYKQAREAARGDDTHTRYTVRPSFSVS